MKTFVKSAMALTGLVLAGLAVAGQAQVAAQRGDPVRGKRLFMQCAACHALSAKAAPKAGPHLEGIVGRRALAATGFRYSAAMRRANLRWDEATLDRWLARPAAVVPGTSMAYAGMRRPEDRAAIIAYLKRPTP